MHYSQTPIFQPAPFRMSSGALAAWVSILGWTCLVTLFFIFYPGATTRVNGDAFVHRMRWLAGDGATDCGHTEAYHDFPTSPLISSPCVSRALAARKPFSVTYQVLWGEDDWTWTGFARSKDGRLWQGSLNLYYGKAGRDSPEAVGTMYVNSCAEVVFESQTGALSCRAANWWTER